MHTIMRPIVHHRLTWRNLMKAFLLYRILISNTCSVPSDHVLFMALNSSIAHAKGVILANFCRNLGPMVTFLGLYRKHRSVERLSCKADSYVVPHRLSIKLLLGVNYTWDLAVYYLVDHKSLSASFEVLRFVICIRRSFSNKFLCWTCLTQKPKLLITLLAYQYSNAHIILE